jgi:hypothetical protein
MAEREPDSDYVVEFRHDAPHAAAVSAEAWARQVFDGPPLAFRLLLRLGWRYGLRLHLARAGQPRAIAGWEIVEATPTRCRLTADSPLLVATNEAVVGTDGVRWMTTVGYRSVSGRILWTCASVLHRLTMPLLLRSAARALLAGPSGEARPPR